MGSVSQDSTGALNTLIAERLQRTDGPDIGGDSKQPVGWTDSPEPGAHPPETDAQALNVAQTSKPIATFHGKATGNQLCGQDWDVLSEFYESPSEARFALCSLLLFVTGGNCEYALRLANQLEHMPEKWLDRPELIKTEMLKARIGYKGPFYGSGKVDAPPVDTPKLLFSLDELANKIGPIIWLIAGFIEANANIVLVGAPSSYKSFIAIAMACCVATGREWHGRTVAARGVVVYICGEGLGNVARRFKAWCLGNGVSMVDVPVVITQRAVAMINNEVQLAQLRAETRAMCEQFGLELKLIIIDTLNRNYGAGDENSSTDMAAFFAGVDSLRRCAGASAITVHHSGHSNGDRGRGSSALRANIDAEYLVERESQEPLSATTMRAVKMKDAELPEELCLLPQVVDLGFKEYDGKAATSLVLDDGPSGRTLSRKSELLDAVAKEPGQTQRHYAGRLTTSSGSINKLGKQLLREKLIKKDARGRWELTATGITTGGFIAAIDSGQER